MRSARDPRTPALFCADLAADPLAAWSSAGWLSPGWREPSLRAALSEHFSTSRPAHLLLTGALVPARAQAILEVRGAARRFARWLGSAEAARLHLRLAGVVPDRPIAATHLEIARLRAGQRGAPREGARHPGALHPGALHPGGKRDALTALYSFGRGVEGGRLALLDERGAASLRVRSSWNQALVFESRHRPWQLEPVEAGTLWIIAAEWQLGD